MGLIQPDSQIADFLREISNQRAVLDTEIDRWRQRVEAARHADKELQHVAQLLDQLGQEADQGVTPAEWRRLVETFVVDITIHTTGSERTK